MVNKLLLNFKHQIKIYQKNLAPELDDLLINSINEIFDEVFIDLQKRNDCEYWLKLRHRIFHSKSVQKDMTNATYSLNLMLVVIILPSAYLLYQIYIDKLTYNKFTYRMYAIMFFIMFWAVPIMFRFNQAADLQILARDFSKEGGELDKLMLLLNDNYKLST